MLRLVLAGSYREVVSLDRLATLPNPDVRMLLLDIDLDEGDLELLYLSEDARHLVILGLTEGRLGQELYKIPVVERVNTTRVKGMISKRLGQGHLVVVGDNLLFLSSNQEPQMISALVPLDGGWSNWSDRMCSKNCGQNSISYRIRSCSEPTPRNGGENCVGEGVETGRCTGLRACTVNDCLAHEILNEQTGSCDLNPNYIPSETTGVISGGSGTVSDGSGGSGSSGVVNTPGECPAGKVWDARLYACFTPYVISNIFLEFTERIFDRDGGENILHRYRLSLSLPQAQGVSARTTASFYCQHRGYADVLTYETRTMTATEGNRNVFVLCQLSTNGLSYPRQCPVGWYDVSFTYRNMIHAANEQVTYLHSVTCRQDEGFSSQFNNAQPL